MQNSQRNESDRERVIVEKTPDENNEQERWREKEIERSKKI